MTVYQKKALVASSAPNAQAAESFLRSRYDWVDIEEADVAIVLGGDGFMLQMLHQMLDQRKIIPAYGMNRGTVGFLMNGWSEDDFERRLNRAKSFQVTPLRMDVHTIDGDRFSMHAINEVSLLRETRQAAKIEILVNQRTMIEELVCDGVLVATPAGSTAYNLSANGPILPLGSSMLALTPISPFRPRRWKGAILPDKSQIRFEVLDAAKRPVSAVADQKEVRDVRAVNIETDRNSRLNLLFDPEHALDERIAMEQFVV